VGTAGYLHANRPGRVALVYDLMEPRRPQVDRMVLDFLRSHAFRPHDFVLRPDGVCRLHPQLARWVSRIIQADETVQETVSNIVSNLYQQANASKGKPTE
jgi:CRISPR/Cas system-associated endonuclease Cas1